MAREWMAKAARFETERDRLQLRADVLEKNVARMKADYN